MIHRRLAEESQAWRLPLEDLTESHATPTAWPLLPNLAQAPEIMRLGRRCSDRGVSATRRGAIAQLHPHLFSEGRGDLTTRFLAAAPRLTRRL